jgi:hypothetical protein
MQTKNEADCPVIHPGLSHTWSGFYGSGSILRIAFLLLSTSILICRHYLNIIDNFSGYGIVNAKVEGMLHTK